MSGDEHARPIAAGDGRPPGTVDDVDGASVLYVHGDEDARDRMREAAAGETAELELAVVGDAASALDAVGDRSALDAVVAESTPDADDVERVANADDVERAANAVECVVTAARLPDRSGVALVEAVADRDPDLPVFVDATGGDGGEALAGEATAAGAAGYFPAGTDPSTVLERARAAAATCRRRRRQARDAGLLETIQEHLPVAVYVKDDRARHVWMTDVSEGPDPEEARGKTDIEVYGDDDPEVARQGYEDDLRVLETGEPIVDREERMEGVSEDGYEYVVWTLTTKVPLHDEDGEVAGLVGASWDVTDLKADLRDREELEREFDRFMSFMTHDLMNPLAVARGYLDLAADVDGTPTDLLQEVDDALGRAEEIIDNARSLAVGDDEPEPFVGQVDLSVAIEEAWGTDGAETAALHDEVPRGATVIADRGQLLQLLENLFRNAVDHAGEEVVVEVGLLDRGGGFYVADDGPGIPPERREEVFDLGEKIDQGGTGIGLTIVREVARAHGWEVTVTESASGGARFEVDGCMLVGWPGPRPEVGEPVRPTESRDVGAPLAGRTDDQGKTVVVEGAGENVWRDVTEYRYVYAAIDGDAVITARVADFDPITPYTKVGVVIRGVDDADPLGYVGLTPEYGSEVLWRTRRDGPVESSQLRDAASAPYWYRIERAGDVVTCSVSIDGEEWTAVDQRRLPLGETVHVGLLVNSHEAGTRSRAQFDEIDILAAE